MKKALLAGAVFVSLLFGALHTNAAVAAPTSDQTVSIGTPPAPSKKDTPAKAPKHQGTKGKPGSVGGIQPNVLGPSNYTYAGAQQAPATAPASVGALLTVDDPWLSVNYEWHTLAELAVESANGQQVAEIGWTRDPTTFGDSNVHSFVYWWKNGVPQGYNSGFTNYSGRTYTVGDTLTSFIDASPAPSFGWVYSGGNWWAQFNGTYLGYFPGSNWSGVTPAFDKAYFIQAFGEVDGRATPCTDMASNLPVLATSTSTGAGKFSSMTYDNSATGVSLSTFTTNSSWYNAALLTGSVRSFYYGGPGPC
jgi:hypothetical protein